MKPDFRSSLLFRSSLKYLLRHRIQAALMILGITIGVAVVVAIDLANASSTTAMQLSTQALAGRATHQITAPPEGLDENVYTQIILSGLPIKAAPVVTGIVTSDRLGSVPLQLLGVDPFSEQPFRDYLANDFSTSDVNASQFFTQPGAVVLSSELLARYNLKLGEWIKIDHGGRVVNAYIAGSISTKDEYDATTLEGLILADISTAQELLGKEGLVDRIDLILPEDRADEVLSVLGQMIPPTTGISPASTNYEGLSQLTGAFKTNLTALSFLAMLVGMFLIYNTMTFSIVQRRSLFGIYRCLGVTRREVFFMVVQEALLVGTLGSLFGLAAGIGLGQFTVGMVSQTVNDLYFTTTVNATLISATSLIKGFLLGLITTVLTAIPPALEAASVPPREALSRYAVEHRSRRHIYAGLLIAAGAFLFSFIVLKIPSRSLLTGFTAITGITLGFAFLTAPLMVFFLKLIQPVTIRMSRLVGRLAPRNLVNGLSRTSIAVAALMVSVAVSIGVGLMISSFRSTVDSWLNTTLQDDLYITAPSFLSNTPSMPIDPAVPDYVSALPEVSLVKKLRISFVRSPGGDIQVSATDNANLPYERVYLSLQVPKDQLWQAMQQGEVLVTEALAYELGLPEKGGSITLTTGQGDVEFPVAGIYYDYASTTGTVQMSMDTYREYWNDSEVTALGIVLQKGESAVDLSNRLPAILPTDQSLIIQPNKELRDAVMVVFDRTFAITRALQLLAMIVAFIGILNALGLLQFERQREMGIIRALGLTNREVWSLGIMETFLMGLIAGILSIPAGYTLAWILVSIINQRSFGWSMQLDPTPVPAIQAVAVAIFAALLAGIVPAWRMSRMQAVEAIRYE